jgi:hypothetical protein
LGGGWRRAGCGYRGDRLRSGSAAAVRRSGCPDPGGAGLAGATTGARGFHLGPGTGAKPVIDIDLTVADPGRERAYVPALEMAGFRLTIREPWWHGHRMLQADEPPCNLHVFGFDSPELIKHRIFREWLRGNPGDRDVTTP